MRAGRLGAERSELGSRAGQRQRHGLRRERCGRRAGWRCARAGDSVTISVVLIAWAVRVAARAGGGRCTAPAARGASGADRIGRRSESEGGTSLPAPVLGVGPMDPPNDALWRVEGHVKIRNQDFDSRNSKLQWQGTGKEATQPMRTWRRRRSPPPKRPCGSCGCGPCPAAREVYSNRKQTTIHLKKRLPRFAGSCLLPCLCC
jgi:hypothetical protein